MVGKLGNRFDNVLVSWAFSLKVYALSNFLKKFSVRFYT